MTVCEVFCETIHKRTFSDGLLVCLDRETRLLRVSSFHWKGSNVSTIYHLSPVLDVRD